MVTVLGPGQESRPARPVSPQLLDLTLRLHLTVQVTDKWFYFETSPSQLGMVVHPFYPGAGGCL